MEKFTKNQTLLIFVTETRINPNGLLELSCQRSSDEVVEKMEALTEELNAFSDKLQKLNNFEIDKLCCAKFCEDDQWYRSQIIRILNEDVVIKFIDYDNYQEVNKSELFQLPTSFSEFPSQGLSFILNISGNPTTTASLWTNLIASEITEAFVYKELEITILNATKDGAEVQCKAISEFLLSQNLVCKQQICYPYSHYLKGSTFNAYISHCDSASEIFLQNNDEENSLNELMDEMAEFYANSENKISLKNTNVGTVCACIYSADEGIYRAQVISSNSKICVVRYVDYGNQEIRTADNMFELPKQFLKLNYQAIRCSLYKFKSNSSDDDISSEIVDFASESTVSVKILNYNFISSVIIVEITNSKNNLLKILEDKNLGISTIDFVKPAVQNPLKSLSLNQLDQQIMMITEIDSDGKFYCMSLQNEDELNAQLETLYDLYNDTKLNKEIISTLQPGMICVAKYDEDENFYRAKVLKVNYSSVIVRFLDYGNSAKSVCVYKLPKNAESFPVQAVQCALANPIQSDCDKLFKLENKNVKIKVEEIESGDWPLHKVTVQYKNTILGKKKNVTKPVPQTKSSKTCVKYSSVEINPGESKNIKIIHVSNFDSMWCNLLEMRKLFDELCLEIKDIYSSALENDVQLECAVDGSLCIVDRENGDWCRAEILSCMSQNDVKVHLVDRGTNVVVKKNKLKKITPELLELPKQAVKISTDSSDKEKSLISCFKSLVSNQTIKATFESYDSSKKRHNVKLYNSNSELIDKAYVQKKVAKFSVTKDKVSLRYIHVEDVMPETITYDILMPSCVSFVENSECIWLNLKSKESEFKELSERINEFYNNLPENSLVPNDAFRGLMCVVLSGKNWCRANVICSYDNLVEVKLIDIGTESTVPINEIKCLTMDFARLPAYAIGCSLHNVKPLELRWTTHAFKFLKATLTNHNCICKFITQTDTIYEVIMWLDIPQHINVQDEMVTKQFARWINKEKMNLFDWEKTSAKEQSNSKQLLFYQHQGIGLIGIEVLVDVTEWSSPGNFFVLPHKYKLDKMLQDFDVLKQVYSEKSKKCDLTQAYTGMPCIYISPNGSVFRAAFIKDIPNGKVRVLLVDYGRHEIAVENDIKEIMIEHVMAFGYVTAPTAIRCTLQGVTFPKDGWGIESTTTFESFVNSRNEITCSFHGCISDGISQLFVVKLSSPSVNLVDELNTIAIENRSVKYIGEVCEPFFVKSFFSSNFDIHLGAEDNYFVTHVERADLFFCQLEKNMLNYENLLIKIQLFANGCNLRANKWNDLALQPICLAEDKDNKWYRAHFIAIHPHKENIVKVMFVDYGHLDCLALEHIIPLESNSEFIKTPIQALPCSLAGHDNITKTASQCTMLINQLNTVILKQHVQGVVSSTTNGKFSLDLFKNSKRVLDAVTQNMSNSFGSSSVRTIDVRPSNLTKGQLKSLELKATKNVTCTIISKSSASLYYVKPAITTDMYNECSKVMDDYYTTLRECDLVALSPEIDEIVAAKHPVILKWCRALVLEVHKTKNGKSALLDFFDEGSEQTVQFVDIKRLSKPMLQWPKLTCQCRFLENETITMMETEILLNFNKLNSDFWDVSISKSYVPKKTPTEHIEQGALNNVAGQNQVDNANQPMVIPQNRSLEVGDEYKVYISHICDDNTFYVQLVKDENKLNSFMDELKDLQLDPKSVYEINTFCLASYEDDGYLYRAKVVKDVGNKNYEVFYIDYGNSSIVFCPNIKPLPQQYTSLPQQAIQCEINISPSEKNINDRLNSLEDETLIIKIKKLGKITNVSLFKLVGSTQLKVFKEIEMESAITNKTDTQIVSVCKQVKEIKTLPPLKLNTGDSVFVSFIENLDNFWIQLVTNASLLEDLSAKIFKLCSSSNEIPTTLQENSLCCALYVEDDAWYRGIIKTVDESEKTYTVYFIDYGNTETVGMANIRKITDELNNTPAQAIKCKLVNLKYDLKNISQNLMDDLHTYMQEMEFLCNVVNEDIQNGTNIYSITLLSSENKDINDWCKNNNLEKIVEETLNITNTEKMYLYSNLQKGSKELCKIINVEKINEDEYIQFSTLTQQGLVENEKIKKKLKQISESHCEQFDDLTENNICIAFSDNEWHRGFCLKCLDLTVEILLVDSGKVVNVNKSKIRKIPQEMDEMPVQVINCILKNINLKQLDIYQVLQNLCFSNEDVMIDFTQKDTDTNSWYVHVYLDLFSKINNNMNVNSEDKYMQTRQDVKPLNTDARNSQVQNIPSVPSIILTSDSGKTSPMFFDDSLLLDETIEKDQTLLQPICHLMVDLKSKVLLLNERENLTNEREIIKNILNKLTESIENKENCNNILEKECQIEQKQAGINKENVTPLSSEPSPMPDDVFYDTVYSISPSTGVSTMVGDENVSVEAPKPSEFEIYCSIDKTCDVAQMSPTKEKLPCDSNESAALLSLTKMDSLNEPRDDHSQKFGRNEIGDISTETESAPNDIAMKLNERYNHTNQDIKRYVSCIIEKSLKDVQSKMLQSQHLNEKPTDAVQKLVSDIINVSVNELLDTDSKESGSLNQKICDGALKLSKNAISASLHEMETSEAEEIEQLELENKTATYTLHEINNNQEENDIDKDHTCFTETNSSINTVIEKEDKKLIVKNTIGTSILSDDNDKVKSPLLKTSNLSIASQCVISDVIASLHSENEDVSISSNANKISGGEGDGTNYTESVDKLPNVADADSAVMSSGGGDYNIKVYNLLHFTPKKSKHEDEIFSSPKDSFYLPFRSICPGDKLVLDYVKNDNLDRVYFQITDDSIVNDLDQTMSSWEISDDKELIPLRNVEVGMLCLVQNPSDETWHRGRIMSEISPTEVTVLIIDYGVLLPKPVAVSSLCLLPNKLKLFPPLVLSCKVHGLNIKDPEVISKKSEQLKELCFGYSLLGEVVEVEYENYEQIFDVVLKQEGKQDDIAQIMMSD